MQRIFPALLASLFIAACAHAPAVNESSIADVMTGAIAPASDAIWQAGEPETDAQWQTVIDATNVIIDSARLIKLGGTGPNDNAWAAEADWQAYADVVLEASTSVLAAVEERDSDALFMAGNDLYTPCEACHKQFNPAVQ